MNTQFTRVFNQARALQGFYSQKHLDLWFKYSDHMSSCKNCGAPGISMVLDDGRQSSTVECEVAKTLLLEIKVPT